jgi:hypothetical protein
MQQPARAVWMPYVLTHNTRAHTKSQGAALAQSGIPHVQQHSSVVIAAAAAIAVAVVSCTSSCSSSSSGELGTIGRFRRISVTLLGRPARQLFQLCYCLPVRVVDRLQLHAPACSKEEHSFLSC